MSVEKYSQERVAQIQDFLDMSYELGKPVEYEVTVDKLKVVRRTADPTQFDSHRRFITRHSKEVEITLYTGGSQYSEKIFLTLEEEKPQVPQAPQERGLSGIEIDAKIQEGIDRERKKIELEQLREKNKEQEKEIAELEDEVEKLENVIIDMKGKESPLKGVFGEIGSVMVESFIRRNPHIIASIPGGQALSGLIEEDNKRLEQGEKEENDLHVSFRAQDENESQEVKEAVGFVRYLKENFVKERFQKLITIIKLLADSPERLDEIMNQLKEGKENGEAQV